MKMWEAITLLGLALIFVIATGLKIEYHSDGPVIEPVQFIPQTSNMLDKRNKECS